MRKPKKILVLKRAFSVLRVAVEVFFKKKTSNPEKLRLFFERAGGAFLKFGRHLALNQNLIPPAYAAELLKIRSEGAAVSFADIQNVFIAEIGKPVGMAFGEFGDEPIAATSVAQIYKAKLEDGSPVAVKIQRPDAVENFELDFAVMSFWAGIIDFFHPSFSAKKAAEEFAEIARYELDFRYGANNAMAFFEYAKTSPATVVPKQYVQYLSPKVTVREFLYDGISATDLISGKVRKEQLAGKNIDFDFMAGVLVKENCRQYFIDGFFQANQYPGNLMFLPDNKVTFLDFDVAGEAGALNRLWMAAFVNAIAGKDIDGASRQLTEYAGKTFNGEIELYMQSDILKRRKAEKIFEEIKKVALENFKKETGGVLKTWLEKKEEKNNPYFERSFSAMFSLLLKKIEKYGVRLPAEIILFARSLAAVDLAVLQMSSDFDMIKALNSFFGDYPLSQIEEIIAAESAEEKEETAAEENYSVGDWEKFLEHSSLRRDDIMAAKERVTETILYYAEKYPQIAAELKKLRRKRTIS